MDPKSTTESWALAGPGSCLQRLVFRELLKSRVELQIFDRWHMITSTVSREFISGILKGQLPVERCICWCPPMKFS